jgi:hypothetical protein
MTEPIEKRTWVYCQQPKEYEIALHGCGHEGPEWSEYKHHLWCTQCEVDFIPEFNGIFDGPIPIKTTEMLGIFFHRFNIETQQVELFEENAEGHYDYVPKSDNSNGHS